MQVTTEVKVQVDLLAILRPMVYAARPPVLTVKEIRAAIGASADSTVYNKLNGQSPFTVEEFIAIARACAAKGEFTLSRLVLVDGLTIVPLGPGLPVNGTMADEVKELVEVAAEITTKNDKGDKTGALRVIPRAHNVIHRIEREVNA